MGQPNYPQYPPQGYAPQPPQYGPPQGYPPPPYGQGPYGVPAPAPGYGGPHPQGHDNFRAPDPQQSNIVRPRLLDFGREGRLVLISPIKIDRGVPNNLGKPGEVQDRMTCDVVILDGNPFPYGGQPEKDPRKPHTHTAQIPMEIPSMWISNDGLISQCQRRLGESVLGRLGIKNLPNGNTAYKLDDPTEADMATARQFFVDKAAGKVAAPAQIPATQPYAGPPPQNYMTQPAPVPQYAPPQQPMQGPPPGFQQWAPPVAAVDTDTPPPGADPAWWAQLPAEHRQMIVAQAATARPGV